MALTGENLQTALNILNSIKADILPNLEIPMEPKDMRTWSQKKMANPETNVVLGMWKHEEGGWEGLTFYLKEPSEELKKSLKERTAIIAGQSGFFTTYIHNKKLWVFGWG